MLAGPINKERVHRSSIALDGILSSLAHLDLTDRIQYHGAVMKAHGGYCDVFIGTADLDESHALRPKRRGLATVAIKRLRVHVQSEKDFAKHLTKELTVWSKLRHANILPLLGFVKEGDYPSVISEWMESGTIKQYMKNNPSVDPEPLIAGIAAGVRYLHMKNVVHSDLKADNVLVGNSGEPLICDFGISRILSHSLSNGGTSSANLKGSARWMAPELFNLEIDTHHTKETDMWAFGMTVYEILTQAVPYYTIRNDVQVIFAITEGKLPSRPLWDEFSLFSEFAWSICEACWISPPEKRITIKEVVCCLRYREQARVQDYVGELEQVNKCMGNRDSIINGGFDLEERTVFDQGSSLFMQSGRSISVEDLEVLEALLEETHYWNGHPQNELSVESESPLSPVASTRDSERISPPSGSLHLGKRSGRSDSDVSSQERVKKARRRHQRMSSRHEFAFLDFLTGPPETISRRTEQCSAFLQAQFRSLLQVNRRYPVNFLEIGRTVFALGDETDSLFNALVRFNMYEGLEYAAPPYDTHSQDSDDSLNSYSPHSFISFS